MEQKYDFEKTSYEDIAILPKNTMDIIVNLFTELYDDYRYGLC